MAAQAKNPELSCEMLKSKMEALNTIAHKLAKAPIKLLKVIEDLINSGVELAEDTFGDLLDTFKIPEMGGTLGDIQGMIEDLLNCSFIKNSPMGPTLQEGLDLLQQGKTWADMPHNFVNTLESTIIDAFNAKLEDLVSDLILGKIHLLTGFLNKIVQASGIAAILNQMDQLLNCMSICDSADAFMEKIDGYQKSLHMTPNFKTAFRAEQLAVSKETKKIFQESGKRLDDMRNDIGKFKIIINDSTKA